MAEEGNNNKCTKSIEEQVKECREGGFSKSKDIEMISISGPVCPLSVFFNIMGNYYRVPLIPCEHAGTILTKIMQEDPKTRIYYRHCNACKSEEARKYCE